MKKISLVALLLATAGGAASAETLVPGCPKAFQGFHLGGNIGYGVGVGSQKIALNDGTDTDGFKNKLGIRGVDGGIGVGYTHRLGNWALGLAFDANWASSKGKINTFLNANNGRHDEGLSAQARLKNSLQLYARGGYVIGGQVMPFIGLGWDNSNWQQNFVRSETGVNDISARKSKRFNAFLWKAGVDFLATKHVVLGLEYTGTIANSKKIGDAGQSFSSFKPQYNKFALTAKIVY